MNINTYTLTNWLTVKETPLLIAGPCSVESEEQMMKTAEGIANSGKASALRGGIWKPRTKPGSFEGIGEPALKWLRQAGDEFQLPVITEVANARHVEQALKAGINMLWLGARTVVNPFYVQEIADALKGVDIPVMVKNPIHPEIGLWIGALERLNSCGIKKLAAIHRGFYAYHSEPFRNDPKWEVYFNLKQLAPDLPILCDPSHIAGKSELIKEVCQSALDLGMDGFMIETHIQPEKALSDARQQVTPDHLVHIIDSLETREEYINDKRIITKLEDLRSRIDHLDYELLETLQKRISIVKDIARVKENNQVKIFQMKRWFKILENRAEHAELLGLDKSITHELFQLIHKYSIEVQINSQQETKTHTQ